MKFSDLDGKAINKIFNDKVGENIDRGFSLEVAKRIAMKHIFKLWEKEKYGESDREIH